MGPQARNFAKFAMRATPKNSIRAFASKPSLSKYPFGMQTVGIPGLASQLSPFPPTMSNAGTGISIPNGQSARLFSDAISSSSLTGESLEDLNIPTTESRLSLGSVIEASEDLDAVLTKIMMECSRSNIADFTVIIDFYASWCQPCKTLSPVLETVIAAQKKSILIKVDVDNAPKVSEKYEISSLPTVIAYKNGKVVDSFIGSRNKQFVEKFVRDNSLK